MFVQLLIFIASLALLLTSARLFTNSAEKIGAWMKLPGFVIGIFIVGIGTSLPELISGILSVRKGVSEILPGNIIGANISNLLLITGIAALVHRRNIQLGSTYIQIDLHFLLGSFFYLYMIAYDGVIVYYEAFIGLIIYILYSIYLIRGEKEDVSALSLPSPDGPLPTPWKHVGLLALTAGGIYFGAELTISSIEKIAVSLQIPHAIIALTLLSLGTTLPELAVNISAIRQGKAEMAIGNILGSSVFNSLVIPSVASFFGSITVPPELLGFSLPVMAASGFLFYLLAQDKRISIWEGTVFTLLYALFILQTILAQ
ncbi:MAG TPA: sodium:calcium antiporter [Lacibacter sp.]|nr:sodium:calcium antiporter [Lacibacter sp.]HMO88863.1 sodium:calcium antiporter [Lacibacter sp.]HMP85939.1 sodium:calcium antiporter [Lacibacter sp.]